QARHRPTSRAAPRIILDPPRPQLILDSWPSWEVPPPNSLASGQRLARAVLPLVLVLSRESYPHETLGPPFRCSGYFRPASGVVACGRSTPSQAHRGTSGETPSRPRPPVR